MKKLILLSCAFLFVFTKLSAQDLINSNDLEKIMKDKNVITVFAGKIEDYKKVHITNSVSLFHEDLFIGDPLKNKLKSKDEVAKLLGAQGITNTSKIIVYDEGSGKYAGRVYWVLKYLGVADVKMLDGNLEAWKAGRKPVTKNPTTTKAATFTAAVNSAIIVNTAQVKPLVNNAKAALVDVRAENEYKGTDTDSKLKKGHIPGSVNIEYKMLLNANGTMKSKADIQKIMTAAGVTSDKEVVLVCSSGARSGIVFLALKTILGYPNVKVYDGAFQDWQADKANQVKIN